ncbi:MAG TPA: OAM dimerization domain-containing protein [Sorangium sp.]|uniref:lysine 5,6-aminomutase subunit beta n=1 Tax=unclassified Sorangium TaxID=2621164 RepID=UPI002BE77D99|nr:OAM dimerization domain-containing protein [Sorangium sp.]
MTQRNILRAYGDREGDGMVQMSFTLRVLPGDRAREAAKRFAEAHGLREPLVTAMEQASREHTYFVVYGHSQHGVDISDIEVEELAAQPLTRDQIEAQAKKLGRKIVVVGACTGSDAHTVGIDAILNYKGFAGEKGLESFKCFDAHNLGAQVENAELCEKAKALGADAILVSQVITQRNCHKENAAALIEMATRQGFRDKVILLLGGPRIDHNLAVELGFDAGFGPGTKPITVASFLVERLVGRA